METSATPVGERRSRPLPEIMHRAVFAGLSLLPPRGQAAVLRRYFNWWHRAPDPWRLATDRYERHKYRTTLGLVPARPYRRIVDVGCSEGVFTRLLAAAYPEAAVTGVDVSERALARARRAPGTPRPAFVHADLLAFDRPGAFDLVVCAETLYYLGRDGRLGLASARLTRLLAPGGLLVLVHPWPEADVLHRRVAADAAVSLVTEHVDDAVHRPFAVAVYEREHAAHDGSAPA